MQFCATLMGEFEARVKNIDLRVLAIIGELNRTRSVSQAAENLELSQSAVSMSLAKLRRHFNDPLFVRTSNGMEPTPHAVELIEILQQAEGLLQTALGHHVVFDPATSERCFQIHSNDIAQITFLPRMMQALQEVAPGVRVELKRINEATPKLLESGEADLAIGFINSMGAGYCQQRLFKDRFICAVRADHPRIGSSLSLEQYMKETHLVVATTGTGHAVLEKTLESKRLQRRVGLTVPSFLGVGPALTSLDYIATLPERLALHLAKTTPIKLFPLPVTVAPYLIVQQWHERYTHDPAIKWLRALVAEEFAAPVRAATDPPALVPRSRATASAYQRQ